MKKQQVRDRKLQKNKSIIQFSFKSSAFIVLSILVSTLIFPLFLDALGLKLLPLRVIFIGLTSGLSISYSLFYLDSNRGMSRNFWIVFILITLLTSFISYFWVYNIYYV